MILQNRAKIKEIIIKKKLMSHHKTSRNKKGCWINDKDSIKKYLYVE